MNTDLQKPITEADKAAYERDGVALIPELVDEDWISALLEAAEVLIDEAYARSAETGAPPALKQLWQSHPIFRRFALESPAAQAAGLLSGSREMRLAMDQIWWKEPSSRRQTRWHTDRPGWPVRGGMLPSVWVALTPVIRANGLVCVAESHKRAALSPFWNEDGSSPSRPGPAFEDYEERRSDPSLRFLSWDMNPGDALVFHPWTYHYSAGNPTENWRIAVTTRWFGDDIRYYPDAPFIDEGIPFDGIAAGERPAGPMFPLVWHRSMAPLSA